MADEDEAKGVGTIFGNKPKTQPAAKQPNFARVANNTPAAQPNQTAATPNFLTGMKAGAGPQRKSPLPAPNQPKEEDDRQPQYRLTGKASVQLGGPDDGKVTMLTDDLMPIAEQPASSKKAGADRQPERDSPGKMAGADNAAKAPNKPDFSGLYDSNKRGGTDRSIEPPSNVPDDILDTKEYYKWRAEDFKRRNPNKQPPEYYMNYGDKYAHLFSDEVRGKLSDRGKKWVDKTRLLLQEKIEKKIASGEMDELDPEAFKEIAFEMHSDAYLEGGLEGLPPKDVWEIGASPDKKDLAQWDALREGLEVLVPYANTKAKYWDNEAHKVAQEYWSRMKGKS